MKGEGENGDEGTRDEEDATTTIDILLHSLYMFLHRLFASALTLSCTQTSFLLLHPSKTTTLRLCFVLVFRAPPADSSELLEGSLDERSRGSEFVSDLVYTRPVFLICICLEAQLLLYCHCSLCK